MFAKGSAIKDRRLEYAFDLIDVLQQEKLLNDFVIQLINSTQLQALYFIVSSKDSSEFASVSFSPIKIIIGDSDFKKKIGVLKNLIENKLVDKMNLVKYIDLRYKKVYVGFKR